MRSVWSQFVDAEYVSVEQSTWQKKDDYLDEKE